MRAVAGRKTVAYPFRPRLPAAATTTIPLFHAASTAWHSGSCAQPSYIGRPRERLMTRTLYWFLSCTAFLNGRDHHAVVARCRSRPRTRRSRQIGVGRDAAIGAERARPRRQASVARRDACYVRPMAEIVELDSTDEALPVDHARLRRGIAVQIGMRINSAIDDRDAHSACHPNRAPGGRRVDRARGVVE